MKKTTILVSLILVISASAPKLDAWYPDYSVLATDFPVRDDFLRPLSLHSVQLQGMGSYFQYLYPAQPDFSFMDPTYPLGEGKHIFYMDLGAQQLWESDTEMGITPIYYDSRAFVQDYAFWSPYRALSHEQTPEPALRLFYLHRLGESEAALTLGGAYTLAYDETQFYQPYSFNYFRGYDALGAAYEDAGSSVAYEDYRLKETGDDESISKEHQLNLFLSKAISQHLTIGARLGMVRASVDGNYRDFQYNDRSEWVDEYESYWDDGLERVQSTSMNDINLGISYMTPLKQRFAINGGIITGSLDRTFNELDSSRNYSVEFNPDENPATVDSNIYRSTSYYKSDKEWLYDGNGYYLRFLAELPKNDDLTIRIGGSAEWRSADLNESENMLRRSDYYNQYWSSYHSIRREYESQSKIAVDRSGTGSYESEFVQLSAGVDWQLQPNMRFFGGLYLEHYDRSQDAQEPFTGRKYAYNSYVNYDYDYGEHEGTQDDVKTFVWQQDQWRTVLAAPLGVEYQLMPAVGLQLGLTKIYERMRVVEGYDVIVEEYHLVQIEDGVTTRDELDTDYVDGYQYPSIKEFENRFDFNAGLNIRSGDRFRLSVVLSNAYRDEFALKVGGSISW